MDGATPSLHESDCPRFTAEPKRALTRAYLSRLKDDQDADRDADARILSRKKANFAGIGDTIKLRWKNGVLVPQESHRPPGAVVIPREFRAAAIWRTKADFALAAAGHELKAAMKERGPARRSVHDHQERKASIKLQFAFGALRD